jgi:hypothetical protein
VLQAGASEASVDGLPGANLGITLARHSGQVIRREANYESSHQFPGVGLGGSRNF